MTTTTIKTVTKDADGFISIRRVTETYVDGLLDTRSATNEGPLSADILTARKAALEAEVADIQDTITQAEGLHGSVN